METASRYRVRKQTCGRRHAVCSRSMLNYCGNSFQRTRHLRCVPDEIRAVCSPITCNSDQRNNLFVSDCEMCDYTWCTLRNYLLCRRINFDLDIPCKRNFQREQICSIIYLAERNAVLQNRCLSMIERLIRCLTVGDFFGYNLGIHYSTLPSLGLLGKISLVNTFTSVVVPVENFMLMRPLRSYKAAVPRARARDRCYGRSSVYVRETASSRFKSQETSSLWHGSMRFHRATPCVRPTCALCGCNGGAPCSWVALCMQPRGLHQIRVSAPAYYQLWHDNAAGPRHGKCGRGWNAPCKSLESEVIS